MSNYGLTLKCGLGAVQVTENNDTILILVENCDFFLPHLHLTPPLGGRSPSVYCHQVWYGETWMVWLYYGENMFTRFDTIHERDWQV